MPRERGGHGPGPERLRYPVLCHQFPGRDRQETLDEIYLDNLLTCQVNGSRGVHIPQGDRMRYEVYRMITRGTIEEKILELQESKKNLVTTVLDGNESRASMSIEEIKEILGISS